MSDGEDAIGACLHAWARHLSNTHCDISIARWSLSSGIIRRVGIPSKAGSKDVKETVHALEKDAIKKTPRM
jgi:hypothetical protein